MQIQPGIVFESGINIQPHPQIPPGQQEYTTAGTYSWTCPVGVTHVNVVCIGGGGGGAARISGNPDFNPAGGGGGLGWKNSIPVVPGQTYTVVVGVGPASVPAGQNNGGDKLPPSDGGASYFIDTSIVAGFGGQSSNFTTSGFGGGYVGDGGGTGGAGGTIGAWSGSFNQNLGGGGAGGYTGNGGQGGSRATGSPDSTGAGLPGSGGGGGGGGGRNRGTEDTGRSGGGGGGTSIYGQGASGGGGSWGTTAAAAGGGGGGSGGTSGAAGGGSGGATGGLYGGGGGGVNIAGLANGATSPGGGGAVRIIWSGTRPGDAARAFPSTNTGNL